VKFANCERERHFSRAPLHVNLFDAIEAALLEAWSMRIASFAFFAFAAIAAIAFAACGPKKMPQGPAPEYEEPRAPSWYDAGPSSSSEPADAAAEAGK